MGDYLRFGGSAYISNDYRAFILTVRQWCSYSCRCADKQRYQRGRVIIENTFGRMKYRFRRVTELQNYNKCGVVYQLTCHDCEASYIGETERALKQRLKEHHKDSSPVGHHMGYNNHELDSQNIRIVDRDSRWFQRGVREAIEIRSRSPTLNRDRGRHNLPSVYNTIVRSRDTRMTAAVSRDPNQS